MENGTVCSTEGTLIQVPNNSKTFDTSILEPLQTSFLYEDSKHCFSYESAVLLKSPILEEKYRSFRAKRRNLGYSEADLEETYGFLLFDDFNTATDLGRRGLLRGTSACTTLGDPSKGVYICQYSDCLEQNRWYHGKSGYIAIFRLTKGRVKEVPENYTQDLKAPTVGYDCHVSNQLPLVSACTSSFLAFERTQCYIYELVGDESGETALSPSQVCPVALVAFSYTDSKTELHGQMGKSTMTKMVQHYMLWRGRLHVGSKSYNVGIRSMSGFVLPAELSPVVIVHRAISMEHLRQILPESVFESRFSAEVFEDGLYCTLLEMVSEEETDGFALLLQEMKEKDVAFAVPLVDWGFLFLLHPSHFLNLCESSSNEALRGLFVFPRSRVVQKELKTERNALASNEILEVLPVFCKAEAEIKRLDIQPDEELCKVLANQIQEYAELINPGVTLPQDQSSNFPDQYDMPNIYKQLQCPPEWTKRKWQNFNSYISKPESFQLGVSKARELLATGKEEAQDFDGDLYISLSSPDESPVHPVSPGPELKSDEPPSEDQTSHFEQMANAGLPTVAAANTDGAVISDVYDHPNHSFDEPQTEIIFRITSEKTVNDNNILPPASSNPDKLPSASSSSKQTAARSLTDEIATSKRDFKHGVHNETSRKKPKVFHPNCLELHQEIPSSCHSIVTEPEDKGLQGQMRPTSSADISKLNEDKTLKSVVLSQLTACFLKREIGRWDLRPVISSCGRFLVPFGSLKEKDRKKIVTNNMQLKRGVDCVKKPVQVSVEDEEVNVVDVDEEKLPETPAIEAVSNDYPESSPLRPPEESSKIATKDEEGTGVTSPEKDVRWSAASRESLLNKLKHRIVWSNEKKKKEKMVDTAQESCSKKTRLDPCMSKSDNIDPHETDPVTRDVSQNMSIDPAFALALGLTPKETTQTNETNIVEDDPPCNSYSSAQLQIKKKPLPIFLKRTKVRRLKRQPEVPLDQLEEKWWMHFKTMSCDNDSKNEKDCSVGHSVCNDVLLNKKNTSPSSNALTILADLALSSSTDNLPQQNKEDTKRLDVSSKEDSLLQLLLKKPADRPNQPLVPHTSKPPVDATELLELVGREHSYSTPPHFIRVFCLPAITFQVPLVTGDSSQVRQQQQTMPVYGMETQPIGECKETNYEERDCQSPGLGRKTIPARHFVKNGSSVKITRYWKENYDFNYDSRFSCDPKDRTIIRALHGAWDTSVKDTNEDMRLVVHMWIALFYSRSTDRFFQLDSNVLPQGSEDSGTVEKNCGVSDLFPAESHIKSSASSVDMAKMLLRNNSPSSLDTSSDPSHVIEDSVSPVKSKVDVSDERKELVDIPEVGQESTSTLQAPDKISERKEEDAKTSQEEDHISDNGTQATQATALIHGFNVEKMGVTNPLELLTDDKMLQKKQTEALKVKMYMDAGTVNEQKIISEKSLNTVTTCQKVMLGIDTDIRSREEKTSISHAVQYTSETNQVVSTDRTLKSGSASPTPGDELDESPSSSDSVLTPPVEDKLAANYALGDVSEVPNQSNVWPNFYPDINARTHRVLQSLELLLRHSQPTSICDEPMTTDRTPISNDKSQESSPYSSAIGKHPHHLGQTANSTDLHQVKTKLLDCSHLNSETSELLDHQMNNRSVQPFSSGRCWEMQESTTVQDHLQPKLFLSGGCLKTDIKNETKDEQENLKEPVRRQELKRNFTSSECGGADPIFVKNTAIPSSQPETICRNSKSSVQNPEGCNLLRDTRERSIEEGETCSTDGCFSGNVTDSESMDINENEAEHIEPSLTKARGSINQSQDLLSCTVCNTNPKPPPSFFERLSTRCIQNDPTQASVDQECLIFSEKMKLLLKSSKNRLAKQMKTHENIKWPFKCPATTKLFNPVKHDFVVEAQAPGIEKIELDISNEIFKKNKERILTRDIGDAKIQKVPQAQELDIHVSAVTECAVLYTAIMDKVCGGQMDNPGQKEQSNKVISTESEKNRFDPSHMTGQLDESYKNKLNSLVKRSLFSYFIMVTSKDSFFEKTKTLLEVEGHFPEHPAHFLKRKESPSSLFVILRNEDIAEHICEVPYLLELKKSPNVRFAGIDEPDDIINLTYRELFLRGGFIMVDQAALDSLSLCQVRQLTEVLKELSKSGKWKWILHYRIRHRLNVNARSSTESKEKKHLLDECEEAGLLEVLPYHDCDLRTRDGPDYSPCLANLQIQNISARFSIFLSDVCSVEEIWRNGISTMTVQSFLKIKSIQMLTC